LLLCRKLEVGLPCAFGVCRYSKTHVALTTVMVAPDPWCFQADGLRDGPKCEVVGEAVLLSQDSLIHQVAERTYSRKSYRSLAKQTKLAPLLVLV
jgi:hypothetical protein